MTKLSPDDIVVMFLGLAVLLGAARVMGEVARRFGQPAVLGEIVAGVLLGRTALGKVDPALMGWLFPSSGAAAVVQEAFSALAAALFLLIAGMEVDLSRLWRQGRTALSVSAGGIAVPFALGFAAAWFAPAVLGAAPGEGRLVFALFFATALSISALPVIAKTLMELNLLRSDLGMVVIAAAICNDLLGWVIFAVILGMIGAAAHGATVGATIVMTLG
ncbi:MAG: cation:proton antiporter, partial [Candidatus Methylomirabilis sp.]|nr:cation:proton antiporter [Deltaproteobacteria bacterium]